VEESTLDIYFRICHLLTALLKGRHYSLLDECGAKSLWLHASVHNFNLHFRQWFSSLVRTKVGEILGYTGLSRALPHTTLPHAPPKWAMTDTWFPHPLGFINSWWHSLEWHHPAFRAAKKCDLKKEDDYENFTPFVACLRYVGVIWSFSHSSTLVIRFTPRRNSCCISKSTMRRLQKPDWTSDLLLFSYGYRKCMLVEFVTVYIGSL